MKNNLVSERALVARINRRIYHDGLVLKKCRENSHWLNDLGYYYGVDFNANSIAFTQVGIEEHAELGVLKPEEVAALS